MSKTEQRHNETPIEEIAEVAAYQAVKARYDAFKAANPDFFNHLDALQEELNTKLQAADKVVRARSVSCGDFALYQFQVKYNAEELLQAVGRDKFLQVGGEMSTQTVYGVEKKRVDAAIASGAIPPEVAARVRVTTPRYHKPIDLVLL